MPGAFYGAVEVIPSQRRRASTDHSTGLDYSSSLLVDEDIISRIHSLLVPRNGHWSPQSLSTSEESSPPELEPVSGFDFGSAKSVAKVARQVSGRLSVPEIRRLRTKSTMTEPERKPSQPLKSILRVSSSANDLKTPVGQPASPEPKSVFRFPKLVLRDKKPLELEGIRSCVEINPLIPENDQELHETELDCCPPCGPTDLQPSKYLVKHSKLPSHGLEIEATDLACFMGGCEPGLKDCSKHRRRSGSVYARSPSTDQRIEEDFRSIPEGLARLGITVKGMKSKSAALNTTDGHISSEPLSTVEPEQARDELRKPVARSAGRTRKSLRSPIERALSPISSVTSGSTMDAFPLAAQSLELADKERSPGNFSTAVATNFSLPGYKSKRASQSLRTQLAEISARIDENPAPRSPKQVSTSENPRSRQSRTSIPRKPVPSDGLGQDSDNADLNRSIVASTTKEPASNQNLDRKQSGVYSGSGTTGTPLPKRLDSASHDTVREKRSDTSLKSNAASLNPKPYSASLLSGASRTSVIRHALLKSPITETQPLDNGLPVPPLLSAISSLSEKVMPSEAAYDEILKSAGSDKKGKASQRETEYFDTSESMGEDVKAKTKMDASDVGASQTGATSLSKAAATPGSVAVNEHGEGHAEKSERVADSAHSSNPTRDGVLVPISGHLTDLQKAKDLVDSVRGRIQEAEEQMIQAMAFEKQDGHGSVTSKPTDSRNIDKPTAEDTLRALSKPVKSSPTSPSGTTSPKSHQLGDCQLPNEPAEVKAAEKAIEPESSFRPKQDLPVDPKDTQMGSGHVTGANSTSHTATSTNSQQASQYQPSRPPPDISNAEYWGFVPAVKEAVQNAVQIAVRNAVHDIAVPPGMDPSSNEYRQLVSASLMRASKNADEQIQRVAARKVKSPLDKDSESTVVLSGQDTGHPKPATEVVGSREIANGAKVPPTSTGSSPIHRSYPGSVSSRENDPGQGKDLSKPVAVRPDSEPRRPSAAQRNSALPSRPFSAGELDSIPLDADEKAPFDTSSQGWRLSKAYGWKKGSSANYTAIPTRQSSRNRILGPKTTATNSSAKVSAQGSPMGSRKRSYDCLISRNSQSLRSVSSAGSLRSAGSADKDKDAVELAPLNQPSDHRKSISSASFSVERLGRKNTVHWLKDLLSTNGPYETRFTALPPRTKGTRPIRAQTAPAKPIDGLYLGKTPKPSNLGNGVTKPQPTKARESKRTDISETFTRTIKDLENLMNEALFIARQATDSPSISNFQDGLEKSINVLHDSQKGITQGGADPTRPFLPNRVQSRISATRCSDSDMSDDSVHESVRSYSGSSESDLTDDENPPSPTHDRGIKVSVPKIPSKRGSGWPPTGRVSTPYPPASFPQSRASLDLETRPDHDRVNSIDPIKAADPRSMRTETNVDITQMDTTSRGQTTNRNSNTGIQPTPRRMTTTTFPPLGPEDNQELDENGQKPEFRTLEPFSAERGSNEHRKSSAKSPTRLTPKRATVNSTTAPDTKDTIANVGNDRQGSVGVGPLPQLTPRRGTGFVPVCSKEHSEEDHQAIRAKLDAKEVPGKQQVRDYILENHHPPITNRASSLRLRHQAEQGQSKSKFDSGQTARTDRTYDWQNIDQSKVEPCSRPTTRGQTMVAEPQIIDPNSKRYSHSLDGSQMTHSEVLDFETGYGVRHRGGGGESSRSRPHEAVELQDNPGSNLPPTTKGDRGSKKNHFSLGGKRHLSLRDHHVKGFSLARSHKRQTIARDWSPGRKRFVATVACISTALIGILVGIYAGETPAIQYYIVDFHHYTVLGNVFFFIGLAIPTFFFWPLPLLHGRKPYIMGAMSLAMPLLFPQALAVGQFRSPYVATWRVGLILSRSLMGFCLGFANMNFKQMLTDLFGASLQSTNPHQEHVDEFDVRRHGGGMGVWLGLWTWSALGSIGIGFMIGAVIIDTLNPAWGFYVSICIIAFVMLLNVLCPEVRRSAFRRSVTEVLKEGDVSRRLARGEVKMHMFQTGPKWWGEEFHAGAMLTQKMLRQPGFLIMALYTAWIYGQQVLITLLLGALMSKDYKFKSPQVGAASLAIPVGALLAIPFQKASIFSRARQLAPVSDDGTFKKKISWTSHMVRRSIFVLCLPLAGIAYTLSSGGPPIPWIIPVLFAALVGFLSNLAMAECHGIIMETFDTSDLQPGMTGRSRGSAGSKAASKRTNYSSFPRVASGFAITQGFGYLIAAAASGVGGVLTRHLGQQAATGVMAGILLILSILLLGTLIRYTDVQIIPDSKKDEMEQYHNARRVSAIRQQEGFQEEEPWRPIIIGNPHHTTRRMCLLELGSLSRFSEIRLKNKLVDELSLEAKHPNQAAMNELANKIHDKEVELVHQVRRSLSRHSSRGSKRSRNDVPEAGDLGGHREMLHRGGSGNGSGRPAAVSRGTSGRESARKGTSLARKGIQE
ncbi:hypothetical protein VTL71DRAFT_12455 [Oculimacula yallundae]|uniref:Uncharacterized protein n=1 Tax=Oculimacula yallundae TaxID=86028 RepID=A0ABR4CMN1_9HELO